jgi:predicted lipoprotein with Yx(FWY)xxD motif
MRIKAILVAALALFLAGCGGAMAEPGSPGAQGPDIDAVAAGAALPGDEQSSEGAPVAERRAAAKPPRHTGTWVKVRGSEYGKVLVDARGRTLYLLDSEADGRSECYGDCARAWPPLLTKGSPKARGEAKQGLLGRTTRRGGGRQVTYRGHPLYRYAPEGPRQILCQDVFEFGGTWLVVKPSGKPVR